MIFNRNTKISKPSLNQSLLYWVLKLGIASGVIWLLIATMGEIGNIVAILFAAILGLVAITRVATKRLDRTMILLAYLAGVEPAIRMYATPLRYMYLEYIIIACAVISLIRTRGSIHKPILFYGLYLLVDIIGLINTWNFEHGRAMVILTAGMLGIMILASRAKLDPQCTHKILGAFLMGSLSIGFLAIRGYVTGEAVVWTLSSSSEATGGMGANQIGILLAFGAVTAIILSEMTPLFSHRIVYFALAGMQTFLSLLSFTRGAGFILGGAAILYIILLPPHRKRSMVTGIGALAVLVVAAYYAAQFTDTMLVMRYRQEDPNLSGRKDLTLTAWYVFLENPMIGVGTANFYEKSTGRGMGFYDPAGAHNELMRSMAEHGIIGLILWLGFAISAGFAVWRGAKGWPRMVRTLYFLMAIAYLFHSGLKLALQPLFISLAIEGFRISLLYPSERGQRAFLSRPGFAVPGVQPRRIPGFRTHPDE